jgi:hypothetical protein
MLLTLTSICLALTTTPYKKKAKKKIKAMKPFTDAWKTSEWTKNLTKKTPGTVINVRIMCKLQRR